MRSGIIFSLLLHFLVIGAAFIKWQNPNKLSIVSSEAIPVAMISEADFTKITKQNDSKKKSSKKTKVKKEILKQVKKTVKKVEKKIIKKKNKPKIAQKKSIKNTNKPTNKVQTAALEAPAPSYGGLTEKLKELDKSKQVKEIETKKNDVKNLVKKISQEKISPKPKPKNIKKPKPKVTKKNSDSKFNPDRIFSELNKVPDPEPAKEQKEIKVSETNEDIEVFDLFKERNKELSDKNNQSSKQVANVRIGLSNFEISALRKKINDFWTRPHDIKSMGISEVKLKMFLKPNGRLDNRIANNPQIINLQDSGKERIVAESVIRAVINAQPYDMLPVEKYSGENGWRSITISVDPHDFSY